MSAPTVSKADQLRILRRMASIKPFQWRCRRPGCDGMPHPDPNPLLSMPHRHARAAQLPPPGNWYFWFLMAGRGFGKTRTGAEWIKDRMMGEKGHRVAVIVPDFAVGRDVCIEGESGLLGIEPNPGLFPPDWRKSLKWNRSIGELTLANGSQLRLFGTETRKDAESLRGYQCFVAGTMVRTEHGERPIESIKVGDWVWTRDGLRPVRSTSARRVDEVIAMPIAGRQLVGTPSHLVWTETRGWVALSSLHPDDTIIAWNGDRTTEDAGTATATSASTRRSRATAGSGSRPTAPCLTAGTSTTLTETAATTNSTTSLLCREKSTCYCTPGSHEPSSAATAGWASITPVGGGHRCAAPSASRKPFELSDAGRTRSAASESSGAPSAASSSEPEPARCVRCGASTSGATSIGAATVYNLEIDGLAEYFANDVLVHNCHSAWFEELGTQRYGDVAWSMLEFALRLGSDPRVVVTGTPRPTKLIKQLVKDPDGIVTNGTTYDNQHNLPEQTVKRIKRRHEGTTLGQQELFGLLLDDAVGALWNSDLFVRDHQVPDLVRIVVGVDPAGSAHKTSDLTGIVAVGLDEVGKLWVLADKSGRYSPEQWRRVVYDLFDELGADAVVGEQNFGGDMVAANLRAVPAGERQLPYIPVHASRGKVIRARPVLGLYEQRRVVHVGTFGDLEQDLTSWIPPGQFNDEGDPIEPSTWSPDRMDAMVWAASALAVRPRKPRTTSTFVAA